MTKKSTLAISVFAFILSLSIIAPAIADSASKNQTGTVTPSAVSNQTDKAVKTDTGDGIEIKGIIWVATDFVYTVKKGDNLTRIAQRFQVPLEELTSKSNNPKIAGRKNGKIYVNDKIRILHFRLEPRPFDEVTVNALVVTTKDELVRMQKSYKERITELERQNAAQKITSNLLVLLTITLAAVIFLLLLAMALMPITSKNDSGKEVIENLRALTGRQLIAVMDEPFIKDEVGNLVTLKKVKDFLAKPIRVGLIDLPANKWEAAMKTRESDCFSE
ncbi:MAG: LysM peptidoglycan-binding domain-containing protein [bacterium]|nr:LysM peptidoglycan-binding domain-containing protein [bacterium]